MSFVNSNSGWKCRIKVSAHADFQAIFRGKTQRNRPGGAESKRGMRGRGSEMNAADRQILPSRSAQRYVCNRLEVGSIERYPSQRIPARYRASPSS